MFQHLQTMEDEKAKLGVFCEQSLKEVYPETELTLAIDIVA